MNSVESTWNRGIGMVLTSKTWILATAALGSVAITGVSISPSVKNQWVCLTQLDEYDPIGSIQIRVPEDRQQDLIAYIQDFADNNGMSFGVDVYPAGSAAIEHKRLIVQACSRALDINLRNTFSSALFDIHFARGPRESAKNARELLDQLIKGLDARFERASPEEMEAARA